MDVQKMHGGTVCIFAEYFDAGIQSFVVTGHFSQQIQILHGADITRETTFFRVDVAVVVVLLVFEIFDVLVIVGDVSFLGQTA